MFEESRMSLILRISRTKRGGLFIFCLVLYLFVIYTTVSYHSFVGGKQTSTWESDITYHIHGYQQRRHQSVSSTAHHIKLGKNISNALYKLYIAKGRPVETSLLISDEQNISIISVDGDDDDYKDEGNKDDHHEDTMEPDDKGENRVVVIPEKFLHSWNESDPVGLMNLPLATGNQDEKNQALENPAVIFNRVGKCGSRSVLRVVQKLAKKNRFYLVSSLKYDKPKLEPSVEEKIVNVTSSLKRPNMFQRHVHFIDYTRHQKPQPLYINIIRDPLERLVSHYYYSRFGDNGSEGYYRGNARNQTFDECVLSKSLECLGARAFYIIPFFCGQDYNCTRDRSWALKKAVENLDKYYIVTGILEELEDTFRVFEKVLPSFFKGALDFYQSQKHSKNINSTSTKHKIKPSPEVSKFMKGHMKLEYTFYKLVKKRFHDQKRRLGIV